MSRRQFNSTVKAGARAPGMQHTACRSHSVAWGMHRTQSPASRARSATQCPGEAVCGDRQPHYVSAGSPNKGGQARRPIHMDGDVGGVQAPLARGACRAQHACRAARQHVSRSYALSQRSDSTLGGMCCNLVIEVATQAQAQLGGPRANGAHCHEQNAGVSRQARDDVQQTWQHSRRWVTTVAANCGWHSSTPRHVRQ